MRYWECVLNTPSEEIDARCDELTELGVGGFVVENEEDFRNFLDNNHQYWDYVDQELEDRFAGVSRLKFYVTDDADGRSVLQAVRYTLHGEPGKPRIRIRQVKSNGHFWSLWRLGGIFSSKNTKTSNARGSVPEA
jgi:ribosomal protein L11 methylase PrmA